MSQTENIKRIVSIIGTRVINLKQPIVSQLTNQVNYLLFLIATKQNYSYKDFDSSSISNFNLIFDNQVLNQKSPLILSPSMCYIPDSRKGDGGDDASLACRNIIVVCDGVGSWRNRGIDASEFAISLCYQTYANILFNSFYSTNKLLNPMIVLYFSIEAALFKSLESSVGSSTICVGLVKKYKDERLKLQTINIGDSGYMIIRNGEMLFKSTEMVEIFNFPIQIGTGHEKIQTHDRNEHQVMKGDILVFATDGLWDNMFTTDIIQLFNQELISAFGTKLGDINQINDVDKLNRICQQMSTKLGQKSLNYSTDQFRDGPFAQKGKMAQKDIEFRKFFRNQYGFEMTNENCRGGKEDDITVVVKIIN